MDIKEVQLELKSVLIPLCISLDWSLKDATMVVKWVEVISEVLFLILILVQYASRCFVLRMFQKYLVKPLVHA